MFRNKIFNSFLLLTLSACTATNIWQLDSIATGEKAFDSAKLVYSDPMLSPLRFEVVGQESGIESFISLSKHRLTVSSENPNAIEAQFTIEGEKFVEMIPILEGRMRLRLPPELTGRLIEALQEGKKIDILLDGFEQTLEPERFSKLYEKVAERADRSANPLEGSLE